MTTADMFSLRHMLADMVRAASRAEPSTPGFGHPCSQLIDDAIRNGLTYSLAYLSTEHSEYRINGAGLKLYGHQTHHGVRGLVFRVGGDQEHHYAEAVRLMQDVIDAAGYGEPKATS